MPLSDEQWTDLSQRSDRNPIHSGTQLKADIARFLDEHDDQAFTLTEVAENVDAPVGGTGGEASGLRDRVKRTVVSAGKKQLVKYVLNQLVAEGHVETRTRVAGGSETVYYRSAL